MVPALTTGFVPKVVSSTVGGRSKVREHGNVVRLWLVAWRRSGFAELTDPRTVVHGAGVSTTRICPLVSLPWMPGYWGPNTSLLS